MASIKERGNSWRIRVSCGYDSSGKQIVRSMTWKPPEGMSRKKIEKEVRRQADRFEEDCLKGNVVATIKFEDFARQWFKEYAEIRLKQRTIEGYHQMEKRIYKAIGHIRLDKLTTRHIQQFIADLCKAEREDGRDRNGGKLSTKTIKLYKSMISTICDYAVKMQMIQTNPCKNVIIPRVVTPEKEYYSIEETQHLMDLFRQEDESKYKYVLFYTLAIYTGFRLGELMGLEWKDVNFSTNVITINRTCLYSKAKGGLYTETPKTAQSRRSLKVTQGVINMLKKWKELQNVQREKVGSKWIETDRIFTKWNGLTLDRSAPGYFFKQFCKRTGMRYVSTHSMRHLNASLLIYTGADVKTVQDSLGHSTPITTLSIYTHSFQTAQAAAMDAIAELLPLTCPDEGDST
ncbi:MAG: site-specific integrase [Oscillospiraceae bacterium]|nr:site-specific integrase [Oscillospiraceae bacterium]